MRVLFSKASVSPQSVALAILICPPLLASCLGLPVKVLVVHHVKAVYVHLKQKRGCWRLEQNHNVPWLALSLETWYGLPGRSRI